MNDLIDYSTRTGNPAQATYETDLADDLLAVCTKYTFSSGRTALDIEGKNKNGKWRVQLINPLTVAIQ